MKILQVIPYFAPAWHYGGPVSAAYNLSKELVKMGHSVTVYSTDVPTPEYRIKENEETIDRINIRRFKNLSNGIASKHKIFLSLSMISAIRNNLKEFDIVHMLEYRTIQNVIARHYAKKHRIPYILQAHGSVETYFQKGALKRLFDCIWGYRILKDASRLIALTSAEAKQYQTMGVSEDRIIIVPNGINLSEFENLPQRGEFRRKYGLNHNLKIILYLARINRIKGPDLLVKSFAELSKEMADVKLVITGPDDGYLPILRKLLKELGSEEKVLFTGPLYGRDKLEAYADADVYVLPSRYETFPVGVLEACACGVPVIVTDRCGIADIIDGEAGLVVPYDEEHLQRALIRILGDDKIRLQFGERGKLLVREKFNWGKIAEQVEAVYQSLLTEGPEQSRSTSH